MVEGVTWNISVKCFEFGSVIQMLLQDILSIGSSFSLMKRNQLYHFSRKNISYIM